MAIIIENPDKVKENAQELITNTVTSETIRNFINSTLDSLNQYWQLEQEDAQSFFNGLKENSENIEKMINCNKAFADSLIIYSDINKNISSRTVN